MSGDRHPPTWLAAPMVLVGVLPGVGLYFVSTSWWSSVLAGLFFWPFAFLGGGLTDAVMAARRTPEAAKPLTPESACKPAGGGTDG